MNSELPTPTSHWPGPRKLAGLFWWSLTAGFHGRCGALIRTFNLLVLALSLLVAAIAARSFFNSFGYTWSSPGFVLVSGSGITQRTVLDKRYVRADFGWLESVHVGGFSYVEPTGFGSKGVVNRRSHVALPLQRETRARPVGGDVHAVRISLIFVVLQLWAIGCVSVFWAYVRRAGPKPDSLPDAVLWRSIVSGIWTPLKAGRAGSAVRVLNVGLLATSVLLVLAIAESHIGAFGWERVSEDQRQRVQIKAEAGWIVYELNDLTGVGIFCASGEGWFSRGRIKRERLGGAFPCIVYRRYKTGNVWYMTQYAMWWLVVLALVAPCVSMLAGA